VSAALNVLNAVSDVDVQYFELCGRLEGCKIEIQDIYHSISDALNAFDFDASDVDRVETRLDKIRGLKRKYGGSVEKTLEFLEKSRQVYDELINADETIATLKLTREKILARLFAVCKKLTVQRKLAALKFEKEIVTELNELGMSGATFQVQFNEGSGKDITEQFITSKGWDEVEFLFSANKGEPAKPLAKIASGGEMSRFMLAVKNITARIEKIPTMIFDEIDAGISGQMASVVAQKLAKISRDYQAVVITHLPQIACMGDNNYLVEKYVDDGRTKTVLTHLDEDGKIREVQRLIGGKDVGQFGGLHAKDMATWADKYKLSLRK
jgi:DNA repair protein RecN (Recombination protein N)